MCWNEELNWRAPIISIVLSAGVNHQMCIIDDKRPPNCKVNREVTQKYILMDGGMDKLNKSWGVFCYI